MSGDVVIEPTKEEEEAVSVQLQGKKLSWQKLRRNDSLDMESRTVSGHYGRDSKVNSFSFQYIYMYIINEISVSSSFLIIVLFN